MVPGPDSTATSQKPHLARIPALVLATIIVALPSTLNATTYYVDKSSANCSNSPSAGSQANPFCTIQYAIDQKAGPDVTIIVVAAATPYAEAVVVSGSADEGSSGQPFVLQASGATVVDGAEAVTGWTARPVTTTSTNKVWKHHVTAEGQFSVSQVHVANTRYPEKDFATLADIGLGYCDFITDTVFVNFGSGDYTNSAGYISQRVPITVSDADYVTIDGFTVVRSTRYGIEVNGLDSPRLTHDIVKNCTVQYSANVGILLTDATACTVNDNHVSYNTGPGIRLNNDTDNCSILRNSSYTNRHPVDATFKIQGIRIGNSASTADTAIGNHLIEANKAYDNSDTGIEVVGSNANTFRYNQSWFNTDHGYDHNFARHTIHVGDLAYGNGHDGISIESGTNPSTPSPGTKIINCILADNGRDPNRRDWELEVYEGAKSQFHSDHNVFYRASRTGECVSDDKIINWGGGPQPADCNTSCCTSATQYFSAVGAFTTVSGQDANSKQGDPAFLDADNGDFRLDCASVAIDGADTTAAGWTTKDVRGFARYDQTLVTNTGSPAGAYGDIGPYELEDGVPCIGVSFGYENALVSWTAPGGGGSLPSADYYEVFRNGSEILQVDDPEAAGSPICIDVTSLPSCSEMTFRVKYTYTGGATDYGNTEDGSTTCSAYWPQCETYFGGGGGGSRARPAREEGEVVNLALGPAEPTPSPGTSLVRWAIPASEEGAPFDLSLFDVAGRRVSTFASGPARAGRFAERVQFQSGDGAVHDGVFFMRLRVGGRELRKTVVIRK